MFAMVVLGLLVLPAYDEPISKGRQRSCENNLRQLRTLVSQYAQQFGGPDKRFPSETGKALWLKLTQTQPPILSGDELEILVCPDSEEAPRPGFTTFRGPRKDMNSLGAEDVLGCCPSSDHPDGVLFLRKDGTIIILKRSKEEQLMGQVTD